MPKHSTPDQLDESMNLFFNVWLPTEEHISNIKQQQIYETLVKHSTPDQSDESIILAISLMNNEHLYPQCLFIKREKCKLSNKQTVLALANSFEVWKFLNILGWLSKEKQKSNHISPCQTNQPNFLSNTKWKPRKYY